MECQTSTNRCEKVATVEQRVQFQVVNICQHLSTFETFRNHPEDHPVFSAEVSHVSKASDPDLPRPLIWAFDRKFTGPEGGNRGPCARSSPAAWCFMMFQSCKLVPLIKKNLVLQFHMEQLTCSFSLQLPHLLSAFSGAA